MITDIRRYNFEINMYPDEYGSWVRGTDYDSFARDYKAIVAELTRYKDFMELTLKANDCYCDAIPWDLDMSKPKCVVCQIYNFIEEDEG